MSVESGVYGGGVVRMGKAAVMPEDRRGDSNSAGYRARSVAPVVFVVQPDAAFGLVVGLGSAGYIQGQTEVESIRPLGLHYS